MPSRRYTHDPERIERPVQDYCAYKILPLSPGSLLRRLLCFLAQEHRLILLSAQNWLKSELYLWRWRVLESRPPGPSAWKTCQLPLRLRGPHPANMKNHPLHPWARRPRPTTGQVPSLTMSKLVGLYRTRHSPALADDARPPCQLWQE